MTPLVTPPRLPIQPLIDFIARQYGRNFDDAWNEDLLRWEPTNERIATITHTARGTVVHWRKYGTIGISEADKVACKALGTHPRNIWIDDYDRAEFHPYLLLDQDTRSVCARRVRQMGLQPRTPEFTDALEDVCYEVLADA